MAQLFSLARAYLHFYEVGVGPGLAAAVAAGLAKRTTTAGSAPQATEVRSLYSDKSQTNITRHVPNACTHVDISSSMAE